MDESLGYNSIGFYKRLVAISIQNEQIIYSNTFLFHIKLIGLLREY